MVSLCKVIHSSSNVITVARVEVDLIARCEVQMNRSVLNKQEGTLIIQGDRKVPVNLHLCCVGSENSFKKSHTYALGAYVISVTHSQARGGQFQHLLHRMRQRNGRL
jgi:hypothetical protein